VLGKRLGARFKHFKQLIDALTGEDLLRLQTQGTLTLEDESFSVEDILIFREARSGTNAVSNRFISIDLDTTLDEALIAEGLAREMVSRIQKQRKDLGFNVTDRIHIDASGSEGLMTALQTHRDYVLRETLGNDLTIHQEPGAESLALTIDEQDFYLLIHKA
jgi:isoleucyl-tRNA synthetase